MFTQFEHQLIKAQIHLKYANLQPLKNWRLFTSKIRIVQFFKLINGQQLNLGFKKIKINYYYFLGFNYSKRAGSKVHPKFINRKELFLFVWK
jgi:hypothetical protein